MKSKEFKLRKEYKILFHSTFCAISWLATNLGVTPGRSKFPSPLEKIHHKFFKILQSRGKTEAIQYLKGLKAEVYQLLSWSNDGVFKTYPGYISKDLVFLKRGEKFNFTFIKLLLTTLSLGRLLRTKPTLSYETIVGQDERKFDLPLSNRDCKKFWKVLGYNPKRLPSYRLNFVNYHRSTKAGPNGHALNSCINDFLGILNDPELFYSIGELGGPKLSQYMSVLQVLVKHLKFLVRGPGRLTRKLVYFSDPEGKTREVAILDYFSQTSLRPLHNYLFGALSKIRQDCTFDQMKYKTLMENCEIYYSIDLTAFTDRFPVLLNHKLLKSRIGSKRANAWLTIMTRPFQSEIGEISYSVGNPMGAYSSWNSTALAHHAIVWKACLNTKVNWKTLPYALLGDDLIIGNHKVALEYCRLIRRMGVHWSKAKTHISPHFFEFAKRIHWSGEDVTPFPVAALNTEIKNGPIGLSSVHNNATDKGWFLSNDGVSVWKGLFDEIGYRRSYKRKTLNLLHQVWSFTSILQGKLSALELAPFVAKVSPIVSETILAKPEAEAKYALEQILLNSIMMLFVESFESFTDQTKHSEPLGFVAEQLTIYLSGISDDSYPNLPDLGPSALPHTHVYGVVCEEFYKSQRRAYLIDTLGGGHWDRSFRNILMPEADSNIYFKVRSSDIMLSKAPKIFEFFNSSIKQLSQYPQLI